MKALPITQLIGIEKSSDQKLTLKLSQDISNHVKTMHAGAQFILAESASGEFLATQFPDLKDKVIPLLRHADIKFKKSVDSKVIAYASVEECQLKKFIQQLNRKKRATIMIDVVLKNSDDEITTTGSFSWFIQQI
ncbi:MAG: DUF4442 domain-containing protein [Epsilonproteobacteria bacterium]|nr:DUF4442 domain-containing protein [Campylobacterota bacterium]